MYDSLGVGLPQTRANLARDVECLVHRQSPGAIQPREQALAFDELHRGVSRTIGAAEVMNSAHILVGNFPGEAQLPLEIFLHRGVGGDRKSTRLNSSHT